MQKQEMTNDAQAIRDCLETLVSAWENDPSLVNECLVNEPITRMSMFGNGFSRGTVARWLANRPAGSDLTPEVVNHVARMEGAHAVQYATVIGCLRTEGSYPRHLAFGGSFVNDLVRGADGWRISTLRFDLQCEDSVARTHLSREGLIYRAPGYGARSLIAGWLGIDDRIGHNMTAIPHTGVLAVNPEFDAPWYVLPKAEGADADEEQLRDLLYRYCFAFDYATFYLLKDVLADDVALEVGGERMEGRRNALGYLKMLRKSTPRTHHSVTFDQVLVDGKTATVRATRIAPDLRSHRSVSDGLAQWADGTFAYAATKAGAGWQITSLTYEQLD